MKKFRITTDAHQNIIKKIGSKAPEQGGILLGKDGVITDFVYDEFAKTSGSTYSLNVEFLNPIIKKFKNEGKELLGIIHSHPFGASRLSNPDKEYFAGILNKATDVDFLFTPIVFSGRETEFHMFPYVFYKDGTIEELELEILPNDYEEYIQKDENIQKPDRSVVENRKQLLVAIRQNITANASAEKEQLLISRLVIIALLFWNFIVFMFGLSALVLTLIYFIITKNLITF
ncbi:MAG: Mov34/MPN/PAD-1 family protein [Bergeyella sp.]